MPHIKLKSRLPGILGLFEFRPETAKSLKALLEALLRGGGGPLSEGERELIAAYVSNKNECVFCCDTHAGAATALFNNEDYNKANNKNFVQSVLDSVDTSGVTPKMKSLLKIAGKVVLGGKAVEDSDIEWAIRQGATDLEIHDTVLIAAAMCMFNRYVDGLATICPSAGHSAYQEMGEMLATSGYLK